MNKLLSGRLILIVEDEILILMMIEDMLADLGCKSVSVTKNEQAIALVEGQVFDAAMLDMNLNGKSSYDVADALVARGVPFVYATGNNIRDTRDGFQNRPLLKKPFSHEQLIEALSGLLPP